MIAGAAMAGVFFWLVVSVLSLSGPIVADGPVSLWFSTHRTLDEGRFGLTIAGMTSPAFLTGAVLVAGAVLYWLGRRLEAVTLVAATVIAYGLGAVAKFAIGRARPVSPVNLAPESEPSFPSGHVLVVVTVAFVALGLAWTHMGKAGKVVGTVIAVVVTVAMAIDRLVVGAHWLTDVVASVALALVVAAVVLSVYFLVKPDCAAPSGKPGTSGG